VSLTQLAALSTLFKCGPLTPGKLAAKEASSPVDDQGDRRAGGTRVREPVAPHPTDGRQAIVALTEEGRSSTTRSHRT